ncbi:hypothetical protein BOTBODRAFT_187974 [Botryobasidium botryosum FD-172 SS1]|uniref:F-box domain-containing protein n=1 Tax=Botryobasidium botryosum (strain FD-172 SS1) TaxID=930990 RepID=A0A067MF36_BOTB1|nr:hypothetical protein BOTBODRAFT_187974 [Botryobasidium botryosum FD-172 SS1]
MPQTPLIPEVLCDIMTHNLFDDTGFPRYPEAKSYSLVCRDWLPQAQRLLHRYVRLASRRAFLAFKDGTSDSSTRPSFLLAAVVVLQITIHDSYGATLREFADLLSLLPNLAGLDIAIEPRELVFDAEIVPALRRAAPINALSVVSYADDSNVVHQLLQYFPAVEYFQLMGRFEWTERASAPPPDFRLKALHWANESRTTEETLHWLLASSRNTLEHLDLGKIARPQGFEEFLDVYGPGLRSLGLETGRGITPGALGRCVRLERLTCLHAFPAEHLDALPPARISLLAVHLAIPRGMPWAYIDIVNKFPALTELCMPRAARAHMLFDLVVQQCIVRGIELKELDEVKQYNWWSLEWLPGIW